MSMGTEGVLYPPQGPQAPCLGFARQGAIEAAECATAAKKRQGARTWQYTRTRHDAGTRQNVAKRKGAAGCKDAAGRAAKRAAPTAI
jgi:hypothetical protein